MEAKQGTIVQVMGPVVDVEFPPGHLPEIFPALSLSNSFIDDTEDNLVTLSHILNELSSSSGIGRKGRWYVCVLVDPEDRIKM